MKKTLVALATLGAFAGVVQAQSSVTLYGIVDAGFSRIDPKSGTLSKASSTTGIEAGNRNGNRWGMRGSEDLGGGMSGIFQIEGGFSLDTGALGQGSVNSTGNASTGRLFGRQAYVGLGGGFGKVALGRFATFSSGTGAFDMYSDIDPFYTGYHTAGLQNTHSSAGSLRVDNSVLWQSPNIGGFQGGLGYSFRIDGGELAGGTNNNNSLFFAGASFGSGPVYVAVTYDRFKLGDPVQISPQTTPIPTPPSPGGFANDPTQTHFQVGGTFDLKVVKLHASYAQENDVRGGIRATSQQAAGSDAKAWMVGVSAPIGSAAKVMASYQKRDVDSIGTTPDGDRKVWGLGFEYSLSKRTILHAVYGSRTDGGSLKTTTSGGQSQYTLGATHFF